MDTPHIGNERDQNDLDRFERIFREYYRTVYTFFRRRGHVHEKAEDLAQQTFLKIFRSPKIPEEANLKSWIFVVAANVHKNDYRTDSTAKRGGSMHEESLEDYQDFEFESEISSVLSEILKQERSRILKKIIEEELTPKEKQVMMMYINHQHSLRQLSPLLNMSENTVLTHYKNARRKLIEALGKLLDPQ